jgi:hypothetical protein
VSRRHAITKIPLWAFVPERALRLVRASAFLLLVSASVLGAWGYRVHAQLTERMIDAGSVMLRYEDPERQDTRRTLIFNGQRIYLSSGMTRHSLSRVLDYYERHCLEHDGGLGEELDASATSYPEVRLNRDLLDPVIRGDRGDHGVVACLYMEERDGARGFMERYGRYQESGDISEVGDMRYVYAEEASDGGTHFVALWTDGSFVLDSMLPREGDAPGEDPSDLSRPQKVRRFVSFEEAGAPQRMTVYRADDDGPTEHQLERFYREDLSRRGWHLLDPRLSDDAPARRLFAAERGERMVTFIIDSDERGRAVATLLEAR